MRFSTSEAETGGERLAGENVLVGGDIGGSAENCVNKQGLDKRSSAREETLVGTSGF